MAWALILLVCMSPGDHPSAGTTRSRPYRAGAVRSHAHCPIILSRSATPRPGAATHAQPNHDHLQSRRCPTVQAGAIFKDASNRTHAVSLSRGPRAFATKTIVANRRYSPRMPYVTYELQSIDEARRVGPIGPDLQAVADECNVNLNIVRGNNEPVIV